MSRDLDVFFYKLSVCSHSMDQALQLWLKGECSISFAPPLPVEWASWDITLLASKGCWIGELEAEDSDDSPAVSVRNLRRYGCCSLGCRGDALKLPSKIDSPSSWGTGGFVFTFTFIFMQQPWEQGFSVGSIALLKYQSQEGAYCWDSLLWVWWHPPYEADSQRTDQIWKNCSRYVCRLFCLLPAEVREDINSSGVVRPVIKKVEFHLKNLLVWRQV